MLRSLVASTLLFAAGCATLDTSRPIEKGEGLWWGTGMQDDRQLDWWSARRRLLEFEASRPAAQRSLTESYVGVGAGAAGLALLFTGSATGSSAMKGAGVGVAVLSLIPMTMAYSDYRKAIDGYNARFESAPAATRTTLAPYLVVVDGGGGAGLAGRF